MSAQPDTEIEVVSPTATGADELADVLNFLEAHESRHEGIPLFLGGSADQERVEVNDQLHGILKRVVQALSQGQSISILKHDQEISTQQAAEILGVSRPTVVRLIDEGELQAHVPGVVRRKVRLADVLTYREETRQRRNRFITESSSAYEDADPEDVARLIQEARQTS